MILLPEPLPPTNITIRDIIEMELAKHEMTFDNSILSVFDLCPRQFLYRKILKLVPEKEAFALTFGSAFHAALDVYYSAQPTLLLLREDERQEFMNKTYIAALDAFGKRAQEEISKLPVLISETDEAGAKDEHSIQFGFDLCAKYFTHYPLANESFKMMVDDATGNTLTEVGWAMHLKNGCLVGKMDGIIDNGDLLEHKTTSMTISDEFIAQYNVNNQLAIYLAALREMTGRTPKKAIVNVIRVKNYKKETEKREAKLWARPIIRKLDAQLDDTIQQFEYRMSKVKEALQIGFPAFYQCGPNACKQFFRLCDYFPLCQAQDAELIQMIMYSTFVQREWSPYEIEDIKDKPLIDLEV